MKNVKISVIVPVYNCEKYLNQCIESILGQTFKEFELILVDDGSTDNSFSILKKFEETDNRIRVFRQKNLFAGNARNKGIEAAKGEYLVFLDADDFFEETLLEKQYSAIIEDEADVCVCGARLYDEDTKKFMSKGHYLRWDEVPEKLPFSRKDVPGEILTFSCCAPWNKIFKKEFIEKEGLRFSGTRSANDLYFGLMSLALAEKITAVPEKLVNYRTGQGQSLQQTKNKRDANFYNELLKVKEELEERNIFDTVKRSFANYALSCCIYNVKSANSGEGYSLLVKTLKEGGFEKLGLFEVEKHRYKYYNTENYETMEVLVKQDKTAALFDENQKLKAELDILKGGFLPDEELLEEVPLGGDVKVSVIIPVYNTEKYIEECVRSVMEQSLSNIEIICVDDGSTDKSAEILKELAKEDKRITLLRQENAGQSVARNNALQFAKGEYVLFLDSDDMLDTEALLLLYRYAKFYDLDELFFTTSIFYETKELEKKHSGFESYYAMNGAYTETMTGKEMFVFQRREGDFKVSPCMQILRKSFLDENKIRFFPGIIHEDNLFTLQCIAAAKRVRTINAKLYKRRVREVSTMTSAKSFKNAYGYYAAARESLKIADEQNFEKWPFFQEEFLSWIYALTGNAVNALREAKEADEEEVSKNLAALSKGDRRNFEILVSHRARAEERAKELARKEEKEIKSGLRRKLKIEKARNETLKEKNYELKEKDKELKDKNKELKEKIAELEKEAKELNLLMDGYGKLKKDLKEKPLKTLVKARRGRL